ncbi:hypothetical protein GCM10009624_34430 [Gordonia sinesedis]
MPSLLLLGPIDVPDRTETRPGVQFGTPRLRCLLAALAMRANYFAGADWLSEILWPGEQVSPAVLHNLVFRLRRALAARGADLTLGIVTRAGGYLLDADRRDIDALDFTDAVADGCALARTDPASALEVLDAAAALWRGPPYGEFVDTGWARNHVDALCENRIRAVEAAADAFMRLHRPADAVARLAPERDEHPYRESLHARLMAAYWQADRPTDGLAAYRTLRQRLAAELGTEPGPRVQALHARILAAPTSPPSEVNQEPAAVGGRRWTTAAPLVGRDEELTAVARDSAPGAVLTVTGPGGVGKTALVRAHAATGTDRPVWVVELAAVDTGDAVPQAVTAACDSIPRGRPTDSIAVADALTARRGLLILDNCEHVVAAAAALVGAILDRCPGVTIVATSRTPLRVDGERILPLSPLAVPPPDAPVGSESSADAVRLFRIRTSEQGRRVGDDGADVAAVAEICRRLDGLPLAIELAAAATSAIAPPDLVQRLDGPARLLSGSRSANPRHRSLDALVAWSYDLLDPAAATLFDQLSIFASRFSLADAEALAAETHTVEPHRVPPAIGELVGGSMLTVDADGYRMLAVLRAFGSARLAAGGHGHRTRAAHAHIVAAHLVGSAVDLYGPGHLAAAGRGRDRLDDIRLAVAYGRDHDPALADEIVAGAIPFLELSMSTEPPAWARALLGEEADEPARPGSAEPTDRAPAPAAWAVAAAGARFDGDLATADRCVRAGLRSAGAGPVAVYLRLVALDVALFRGETWMRWRGVRASSVTRRPRRACGVRRGWRRSPRCLGARTGQRRQVIPSERPKRVQPHSISR